MKKLFAFLLVGIFVGSASSFAAGQLFSDTPNGEWYSTSLESLVEKDILQGYPDHTFKPSNSVSRAELAVVVDRLLNYLQKENLNEDDAYYYSDKLGIKFEKGYVDDGVLESGNMIGTSTNKDQIEVLYKDPGTTVESAIMDLIAAQGKNPNDCVLKRKNVDLNMLNGWYVIDLADKDIVYSEEELAQIKQADEEMKLQGDGPFDGEWMKMKIYNDHLIEACSEYADPAGLATSKSVGAHFEFNDYRAKDKFLFFKPVYDANVYQYNTTEFLID